MGSWKARQLDPRKVGDEAEWSIDNGSETLVAGIGDVGRNRAEKVSQLLNTAIVSRLSDPALVKSVTDELGEIYNLAMDLEQKTGGLPNSPESPYRGIHAMARSVKNKSHSLLSKLFNIE